MRFGVVMFIFGITCFVLGVCACIYLVGTSNFNFAVLFVVFGLAIAAIGALYDVINGIESDEKKDVKNETINRN